MLLAKRVDLALGQPEITYFELNRRFNREDVEQIFFAPRPVHEFALYRLFSRERPENTLLLQQFNRG